METIIFNTTQDLRDYNAREDRKCVIHFAHIKPGLADKLMPLTDDAEHWLADNIGEDAIYDNDGGLYVEGNYLSDIVDGMVEEELWVQTIPAKIEAE